MNVVVSHIVGGLRTTWGGKAVAQPFSEEQRAAIQILLSEIASQDPTMARAIIERRAYLADHAIAVSLPPEQRDGFRASLQPSEVVDGLPYMERVDDLISNETEKLLNATAEDGADQQGD